MVRKMRGRNICFKKLITYLVIITFMFSSFPFNVFAQTNNTGSTLPKAIENKTVVKSQEPIASGLYNGQGSSGKKLEGDGATETLTDDDIVYENSPFYLLWFKTLEKMILLL